MRKFLFLERPRPSPETARTAGSCVSAEGHMTPAVSPALRLPVAIVLKSGPKSGQIRLEIPKWGRDSALPRRRAHSLLHGGTRGAFTLPLQEFLHPLPFCCQFQLC